jgi:hypothetical protein
MLKLQYITFKIDCMYDQIAYKPGEAGKNCPDGLERIVIDQASFECESQDVFC